MELNYNQLLQFFTNRKPKEMDKLLSIPLSKCPDLEEGVTDLSEDLQAIFYTLFTKSDEQKLLNLRAILPLKQHKTAMPVCNKLLVVNEAVYKCYNCTNHESAVLCIRCFERGNHQGHRFNKIDSGGGNCDCGNPDAILECGFCVDHKGKAEEMVIDEEEENYFRKYVVQIFIWALKLHQGNLKKQSELLLTHLVDMLDWLNNESLYYNTLTNKVLFNWENQMIDHILIMGSASGGNMLAKKATEMFLKMFSLEVFKENLAIAYLRAYNRLAKFEETKFQSLFIQLFANNDLVEKIIEKQKISLDPREREYNPNNYYGSLLFMGSIKERAARAFFTPIIENGGVHCMFIDQIQKCVEFGTKKVEEIYSQYINVENLFYSVCKVVVKLIKNTPELLEKQLRNHYNSIMKFAFTKNKIVLIYQRVFVMLVFVYFKCDYQKIDLNRLCEILQINNYQMKDFLKKIAKCFLYCLKEYGKCIGNSGYGRYPFENYVDLYCRSSNGNKIIMLDLIGIKFCAIAFERIKDSESFSRVLIDMLNEQANKEHMLSAAKDDWEDDEDEEEGPNANKPKSSQSAVIFYLGWLNVISFFVEAIIYDRSEVALANQLQINDGPAISEMYEHQFKKLLLNVRELTMHQIESMGIYWFSKPIDKTVIAKYAAFDRLKKKFAIKEDVNGIPVKRQLLKSFTKTPDHYLRGSDQVAMEINDKIRKWRELFFPSIFLQKLYKTLIAHLRGSLDQELQKYIKELANHLKIMNMLFQYDNESIEDIIDVVIALVSDNQKLKTEISALFHAEKKQVIEEEQDKEKNQKRKELLKKKKEEKLKNFKNKQIVDKFLSQNEKETENEKHTNDTCIICHQQASQKPLYYLASTFSSNIVYSILSTEGINPFFLSCFHHVHEDCFLSIAKDKQKIFCPLCKAMTNIIVPTEDSIKDQKVLAVSMQRINILFAMQYRQQFKNIYIQIMKSFIQLFFSGAIEESLISQRQIKLFKLVLEFCRQIYKRWNEEQKDKYLSELLEVSSAYQKASKTKYNIGLLIDFVFMIAAKCLKDQEITQECFKQIVSHCRSLPKNDLNKCISLAQKVFGVNSEFSNLPQFIEEENNKQLKQFIYTFDPPKTIRALLQERKQIENQTICKLGHNICICLICSWKGCFDCSTCLVHTNKTHNNDSLYFNFITGGFYHHYNGIVINIRSLYVNDLGVSWRPKYEDDAFYFEIDMYQKMIQALKSGNLIQMIRSNYEYLKIPDNNSIWTL